LNHVKGLSHSDMLLETPLSLLACQRDAYLRTLDAEVLDCAPLPEGGFAAVLDDTVLYPEGGGQPADHGRLNGVLVTDVQRAGDGRVLHHLERPVQRGPVRVEVDWARRFDHMQQHTAQHLVTALAQDRFGLATIGFHLGAETSTIDLDAANIPPNTLAELEELANGEIRANRAVRHVAVDLDTYGALTVRSRGLPDGHVGAVRLVEIDAIDRNTCGGTHVASTAELQVIAFVRTERTRGRTRLHFLAGGRVRHAVRCGLERQAALTDKLRCGPDEHLLAVTRLLDQARAAERDRRGLLDQLAELIAARLTHDLAPVLAFHQPGADPGFLEAIARSAPADRLLLLTASSPTDPEGGAGVFLLAGPAEAVRAAGTATAELLAGRGGGRPGRYQGKAERLDRRDEALAALLAGAPR